MTERIYNNIEDRAYELAEAGWTVEDITDRLTEEFPYMGANDLADIAADMVDQYDADYADEEEPDWDREMGFDPYEGCYTWDC